MSVKEGDIDTVLDHLCQGVQTEPSLKRTRWLVGKDELKACVLAVSGRLRRSPSFTSTIVMRLSDFVFSLGIAVDALGKLFILPILHICIF